jgi:riboflavin synthase
MSLRSCTSGTQTCAAVVVVRILAVARGRLLTGIGCEQHVQLGAVGADATVKVGGLEAPHGDRERLRGHG